MSDSGGGGGGGGSSTSQLVAITDIPERPSDVHAPSTVPVAARLHASQSRMQWATTICCRSLHSDPVPQDVAMSSAARTPPCTRSSSATQSPSCSSAKLMSHASQFDMHSASILCCPCWHGNPVRQIVPREVPAICWTPLRAQLASITLTLSKLQLPQSCSHCVSIATCRLVQAVLVGRVI